MAGRVPVKLTSYSARTAPKVMTPFAYVPVTVPIEMQEPDTVIVPSKNLVIVRRGLDYGRQGFNQWDMAREVLKAIK